MYAVEIHFGGLFETNKFRDFKLYLGLINLINLQKMNTVVESGMDQKFIEELCSDTTFIQRVQSIIKEY